MAANLLALPRECPICKRPDETTVYRANDDGMIGVVCQRCGRLYLTFRIFERLADLQPNDPVLHRLASYVRKENLASRYPHLDAEAWVALLAKLGFGGESIAEHSSGLGSENPPTAGHCVPTPASSERPRWWGTAYRKNMGITVAGYAVVWALLVAVGATGRWAEVTTAYFAIANLLVLWWYAHSTKQQVEVGLQQHELALRQRREANKPFVVLERVADVDRPGNAHYAVRNIGPGVAVNVYHVVPRPRSATKLTPAGIATFQSVGALGPGAHRVLPDGLEQPLRDAGGRGFGVVLLAEGIATRTAKWTCTLNALTPSDEVLCRIQPLAVQDKDIDVPGVLDASWSNVGKELLDLQEDAKRHI